MARGGVFKPNGAANNNDGQESWVWGNHVQGGGGDPFRDENGMIISSVKAGEFYIGQWVGDTTHGWTK